MIAKSRSRRQIIGLDLLRLIAASSVMFYHFAFWHWTKDGPLHAIFPSWPTGGSQLHFGWIGVEIFFVLSGFVISYSADGSTPFQFFRSRALRLIPGVWVCATLSLIALATVLHSAPVKLVTDYGYTLIFWPFHAIDKVYWTLDIEVAFYALVGGLIRFKKLPMLENVMLAISAVTGVFWMLALVLATVLENAVGPLGLLHMLVVKAESNRILQLLLVQHGSFFALGVVLQRAVIDGLNPRRIVALAVLPNICLLEIMGQNTIIVRAAGGLPLSPSASATCLARRHGIYGLRHPRQ